MEISAGRPLRCEFAVRRLNSPPMSCRLDMMKRILPLAAVLSIAAGPSLSASFAERYARQTRKESRHKAPTSPANAPPKQSKNSDSGDDIVSSFIAKAAKPSHGEGPEVKLASARSCVVDLRRAPPRRVDSLPVAQPTPRLHRPAYQAHAPPATLLLEA